MQRASRQSHTETAVSLCGAGRVVLQPLACGLVEHLKVQDKPLVAHGYAKVWLTPIGLVQSIGFGPREVRDLLAIVTQHRDELEQAWHDHLGT